MAAGEALLTRYDTSLDWDDPAGPSPWPEEAWPSFLADARAFLDRLRQELGATFEVVDEWMPRTPAH